MTGAAEFIVRYRSAYHEAGHAVVGAAQGWPIASIVLTPEEDGETAGEIIFRPLGRSPSTLEQLTRTAAGPVAERLYSGHHMRLDDVPTWHSDTFRLWELCRDAGRPARRPFESDPQIALAVQHAEALLLLRWEQVRAIADLLIVNHGYAPDWRIVRALRGWVC